MIAPVELEAIETSRTRAATAVTVVSALVDDMTNKVLDGVSDELEELAEALGSKVLRAIARKVRAVETKLEKVSESLSELTEELDTIGQELAADREDENELLPEGEV